MQKMGKKGFFGLQQQIFFLVGMAKHETLHRRWKYNIMPFPSVFVVYTGWFFFIKNTLEYAVSEQSSWFSW